MLRNSVASLLHIYESPVLILISPFSAAGQFEFIRLCPARLEEGSFRLAHGSSVLPDGPGLHRILANHHRPFNELRASCFQGLDDKVRMISWGGGWGFVAIR